MDTKIKTYYHYVSPFLKRVFPRPESLDIKYRAYYNHYVNYSGNCQSSSIAYFNNALNFVFNVEGTDSDLFVFLKIINYKPILLIDIEAFLLKDSKYKKFLKEYVKKRITTRYKSTNGSDMANVILYIDSNKVKNKLNILNKKYQYHGKPLK